MNTIFSTSRAALGGGARFGAIWCRGALLEVSSIHPVPTAARSGVVLANLMLPPSTTLEGGVVAFSSYSLSKGFP